MESHVPIFPQVKSNRHHVAQQTSPSFSEPFYLRLRGGAGQPTKGVRQLLKVCLSFSLRWLQNKPPNSRCFKLGVAATKPHSFIILLFSCCRMTMSSDLAVPFSCMIPRQNSEIVISPSSPERISKRGPQSRTVILGLIWPGPQWQTTLPFLKCAQS